MDGLPAIGLMILGLLLLVGGGDLLVRGASALAALLRISPLVIGLTVVAFGTSAPEMAVTVQAAFAGAGDVALGNVVGSNIFNVLFILGVSSLVAPLVVSARLVRLETPLLVGVSFLPLLMGIDGGIGRWDGAAMFLGLLAYVAWMVRQSRRESQLVREEFAGEVETPPPRAGFGFAVLQLAYVVVGLAILVLGAKWLVDGATAIAKSLGVSDLVIGLTIVAAGTSLPEVAASVIATLRGERDIAVGNVVGSNLFNILGVLGLAGLAAPAGVPVPPQALWFDLPVMIAVAAACLPVFFAGHRVDRWAGGMFLGYYVAYTTYLVLAATDSPYCGAFSVAILGFAVPLTVVTLGIFAFRAWRVATALKS